MDDFIRQLTHDNRLFEEQWPKNSTQISNFIGQVSTEEQTNFNLNVLNAILQYIQNETNEFHFSKGVFVRLTIGNLNGKEITDIDALVDVFCRAFDSLNCYGELTFIFIESLYQQFKIGHRITSVPLVNPIEKILKTLQRQNFHHDQFNSKLEDQWKYFLTRHLFSPISTDKNRLDYPGVMNVTRTTFQHFYKRAAENSIRSIVWTEILATLTSTLPELFSDYEDPNDARLHLIACSTVPIPRNYYEILTSSYEKNANLFVTNETEIYATIERFVEADDIKCAERFIRQVIIKHIQIVPHPNELIALCIRLCEKVQLESRPQLCRNIMNPISNEFGSKKYPKTLAPAMFDLAVAMNRLTVPEALPCVDRILMKSDFYPWKDLNSSIACLIETCIRYEEISDPTSSLQLDGLENIVNIIADRAKVNVSIYRVTHDLAIKAVFRWLDMNDPRTGTPFSRHIFAMGRAMVNLIDPKQATLDICSRFLDLLKNRVEDETIEMDVQYESFLHIMTIRISTILDQLPSLSISFHEQVAAYVSLVLQSSIYTETGGLTLVGNTCLVLWYKITPLIRSEEEAKQYLKCLDEMYQIVCESNHQMIYPWWMQFWSIIATKYPNAALDNLNHFLYDAIDRKQPMLAMFLPTFYPKRPELFHARLNDLFHCLSEEDGRNIVTYLSIIQPIADEHPEVITAEQIDYTFEMIKKFSDQISVVDQLFHLLTPIANAKPYLFDKYQTDMIQYATSRQSYMACQCLSNYAIAKVLLGDETTANEYLDRFIELINTSPNLSNDFKTYLFGPCYTIGARYKNVLATKRDVLMAHETIPACRTLIDYIDGNQINEEQQAAMNRTLEELNQMEKRIVHTETNVKDMKKSIRRQELNITNLNVRVDQHDNQLNQLSEQVDLHAKQIEQLDHKTLSYVPQLWGTEVCKFLNRRADNDWRLLGKRFGYSTSELRHWAMQANPSMSLLNEWYMTHKSDEATYGLLKMLGEIGRQDVEQIIRRALESVGELIPDDLPIEIKRLPPVFLSYQWGSQQAVVRLKSHLEQAGYACWMDTGQMGGGDKLFAKIDAGIRGAKVVICCMNKAYAQSDNCSREVHLTISTGKALIPLQMEKQSWPPEGALGPIMSEYLFIRFFDRKSNDENYWPKDKFAELLGQIRYYVAPDPDMISDEYRNWYVPRLDRLIFFQADAAPTNTLDQQTPIVITHPQIMISYQWDYQADIVRLYEKLTRLGYGCWLDIFQMGGGDSLFEKIDSGIRHAKCILACVSPKYTKSINCRREMALSDALKKPIVPLLLEDIGSWPPSGPMSMVFAEKSYLDFRETNSHGARWRGKKYEVLLAQLKQAIPEIEPERPEKRLMEMQRPKTAKQDETNKKGRRIGSAPVTPNSRVCSVM